MSEKNGKRTRKSKGRRRKLQGAEEVKIISQEVSEQYYGNDPDSKRRKKGNLLLLSRIDYKTKFLRY